MGRRKRGGGGIGALLLGALAVILLIPKQVWIALFWASVVALLGWMGWRLFRTWQSARQTSVLPPPPKDTGKTLAEILSESSGSRPPATSRTSGSVPIPQVSVPHPLPSPSAITPPHPRPQATAGIGRAVTELTTSPFGDWANNRNTIAAANRARSDELRAKIAASDAHHKSHSARLPEAEFAQSQAVEDPAVDDAPSANLHQTRWEIERDQVASENRRRAEMLRSKFPDIRIVSEELTSPASAPTPDRGSKKPSEETGSVPPMIQALSPPPLPSSPVIERPPSRNQVADRLAPSLAPSSRPVPVQDMEVTSSVSLHQTPWEIQREQVASENRRRAEMLRAKFPDIRSVSEESTRPASAPTPDQGFQKPSEETTGFVPPMKQAQSPPSLPSSPVVERPPIRNQVADHFAISVAPSSRPVPVQDPVPVRTTSPLRALVEPASPIRQPAPPRWVPFGETVSIRGQEIVGGGFYLGTPRGYQDSGLATIDPTLPFSGQADWRGEGLGYWPRYAGLNDRERGAFLAFLNSERRAATVGIGYVFLYFYGLEHRLLRGLADGESSRAEGQQILDELLRLQQHYGDQGSFGRYSEELLAVGRFKLGLPDGTAGAADGWSLSQHVKAAQAVARQQALNVDLAFAWAQALTDEARSTTWDVVRPEIKKRFCQLYAQRFGEGVVIKPGRSRLTLNYRWAGPGEGVETIQTDLPDITRSHAPIRPLVALVQQAMGELETLRRVRRSKNGTAIAELAAMPEALRGTQVPATFRALASELDGLLANQAVASIATSRLTAGCGMTAPGRLGKREATSMIQALEALGFAIEPDVRFHGHPPAIDGQVIVFRLPKHAARTPSAAYAAALLMLQAALAVAGRNSEIIQSELDVAVAAIERQFALPESERLRIEAHVRWLQLNPITLPRLENRVRLLPASEREAFAGVLLEIAAADGHITPAEVRVIERFYRALELDPARVPADLHHASVGGRPNASNGATLNADVIAEKLAETGRVQSMLAQIFNEAETPVAATASSPTVPVAPAADAMPALCQSQDGSIQGLDAEHMVLLQRVLDTPEDQWFKSDFEAACETLDLLPAGAAEMLNEAAFFVAGEPLLEGDDPMYVNDYVRLQLAQTLTYQKKPSP